MLYYYLIPFIMLMSFYSFQISVSILTLFTFLPIHVFSMLIAFQKFILLSGLHQSRDFELNLIIATLVYHPVHLVSKY